MKLRIVKRNTGYMPQQRVLFFFWVDLWQSWAPFVTLERAIQAVKSHGDIKDKFQKIVWECTINQNTVKEEFK